MILSEEIKRLRIRCFLTQEDFANKLGVAFSTVNRWEQSKSKPNLVAMKNMKTFCDENDIAYKASNVCSMIHIILKRISVII